MITQNPLNCNQRLTAKPSLSIEIPFVNGGTGTIHSEGSFFTIASIAGCDYTCSYGDTCGGALSGTNV